MIDLKGVIIREILIPSLMQLYKIDYDNIRFGVSERNICARLAHHMETFMRRFDDIHETGLFWNYYVDVEYNRMGNGDLKHYENSEHRPQYMVSDLLIQQRGYGQNLLAVEMKRKGNNRHRKEDKNRLKSIVSSPPDDDIASRCVYDTLVGAFIEYSSDDVYVDLFENVNGVGVENGKLDLYYWNEELHLETDLRTI